MRVFITGGSGFIGSAIVQELIGAGHEVVGLARSDQSAAALGQAGAAVHRGRLEDTDSLRAGAAAADGVIHCAFIHDFSDMEGAGRVDLAAIEAFGAELAGSDRPLVIASGTAHLVTPGRSATESDRASRDGAVVHRVASEERIFELAGRGVRSSLVRLAPTVHGEGDPQFIPAVIAVARTKGVSAYIGDGSNRWPAVHRLDAARLFRSALEQAPAGSALHGVAEEGIPMREIATVIGRHLEVPVISVAPGQAAEHFGWLAGFLSLDIPASSDATRRLLAWEPLEVGMIEDLEAGHYFAGVTSLAP